MTEICAVIGSSAAAAAFTEVLDELGVPWQRYDGVQDLAGVEYGSLVVLAGSYPEVHELDAATAEVVAGRLSAGGRVYVEFATDDAGLLPKPVGAPRIANFERIYVASSNELTQHFGPLTVFDEHSSVMLPVETRGVELLSYGTVAGTHTAVFGPAADAAPALLDISVGSGRLLYASTALSNAVRGRYKPVARWRLLLKSLLGSLTGVGVPPAQVELFTEPRVWAATGTKPVLKANAAGGQTIIANGNVPLHETEPGRYQSAPLELADGTHEFRIDGASATLVIGPRADRYRGMVDRGIAWFDRAGMFFDAPDGSKGVAEGFSNELGPDGVPPFREQPRADGYVQVAHAFRMYGHHTVADNLMRLVDDGMQILDRNPLYGSYEPRGDRRDFGATNNLFADDNGWIAMFALAGGQTGAGLRAVEALIRTSHHELGAQTNPWRTPTTLMTRGWHGLATQPFHNALDLSSHWNSSAQSAMLYAYGVTADRRFLDAAMRSLDHMASAYPRARLETSRTCEAIRFLFPLAAAYRYTRKPLYLETMREIAAYLKEHQDVNGGIVEWDGRGPISNEAYGTDEASIFQANGDPVTDQLYGTGYAAMALPLAYHATGEDVFAELATGVLDYLSRIQIDEGNPLLDGTWMRAFDVHAWDYFGSNCDLGWGPYCVETGWSQGPALIGAMMWLSGDELFPDPSEATPENGALARQVVAEFDAVAAGVPAETSYRLRADGRVERTQVVEGVGEVSAVAGDVRAAGEPAWVRHRDSIEVYVRGKDGLLHHSYLHDEFGQGLWRPVGALQIAGDPQVTVDAGARAVVVTVRGADGRRHRTTMSDVRGGHTPWHPVGETPFTGVPAIEYRPDLNGVRVAEQAP